MFMILSGKMLKSLSLKLRSTQRDPLGLKFWKFRFKIFVTVKGSLSSRVFYVATIRIIFFMKNGLGISLLDI